MLTKEQTAHFEAFGFVVLRKLLSSEEMDTFTREANEIFEEKLGVVPSEMTERGKVEPFFEHRPFLNSLLDDDRIYMVAEQLLGADFVLDESEGNLHVGDTAWHGGNSWHILRWIKFGFYLEPLTRDTGGLRAIPGSHLPGEPDLYAPFRTGKPASEPILGMPQSEIPSVALEIEPGDVIVFTEAMLHASFGGRPGRHQHAVSYFANPTTEAEIERVHDVARRLPPTGRPLEMHIDSDRPRVRRMVSRLLELGFEPLKL